MNWSRLGSLLVLIVIAAGIGAIVASLVTSNDLLLDSAWQTPAIVTLGLVVLTVVVFGAIGRPWRRATSTAYW